jgi:hypothetical protein
MKMPRTYACYHEAIKTIIQDGESNKITLAEIIKHSDFVIKREHAELADFNKFIIREIRYLIKTIGKVHNSDKNKLVEEKTKRGKANYYYWFSYEVREEELYGEGVSKEGYFARAVVFSFIEENLREFFPPEIMASLKDDLNNAYNEFDVLGGIAGKMKFIPSGVEVWPSYDIDERNPKDWNLAYHALKEEFVIQADYNSTHNSEIERVHLSPQRVQYANHKVVLLCYIHDSGEVKSYEVSRLMNVKKSADYKFKTVNFNDIETEYEFEALVNKGVKNYFDSVKFGNELKSTPSINGAYLVKAKIQVPDHFSKFKKGQPDTFAIANFLSGFADSMEVIKPDFLREEMKRRADNISKLYSDKHDSTPIIKRSHHVQTGNLKKLKEIDEGR